LSYDLAKFVSGGYIKAVIQIPSKSEYTLELSLSPTASDTLLSGGVKVVPIMLHVSWKRKRVDARNAAEQEPQPEILAHEWRLLLKKEGDMVYRCVIKQILLSENIFVVFILNKCF
jgi:hypothetical protein